MKIRTPRRGFARDLKLLANILKKGKGFILATHQNPDGDAIGSLLGAYHLLSWMKKEVWIYFPHDLPTQFSFLPGVENIQRVLPSTHSDYTHLILLDCGSPDRVNDQFPQELNSLTLNRVVIDHHRTERPFGDFMFIDPDASATGEILYRLAQSLHYPVSTRSDFATCVYTAIFTDTGSFRFSNTTARALSIASRLVRAGADPQRIAEEVYENHPEERLRLLAEILRTLEVLYNGKVAMVTVRRRVVEYYHQAERYLEGFVDYPRSLRGVVIAIQLREIEEEKEYKASMRSKGEFDVEAIARIFGGGGHRHAAGCSLFGTYEGVRRQLLTVVEQELNNHSRKE